MDLGLQVFADTSTGFGRFSSFEEALADPELQDLLEKHPLPWPLLGYQAVDVLTLNKYSRTGVFLPVGAGKTVVATLVALDWQEPVNIVVLPPILIPQWVAWLNNVDGKGVGNAGKAVAYAGTLDQRKAIKLEEFDWWVMSYGIFKNDLPKLTKLLGKTERTVIVDEAQAIKSSATQLFKSVAALSAGHNLMLMTGTELNSPGDAYGYIKLKSPSVYRSKHHFDNLHVADRDFFDQPVAWKGLETMRSSLYLMSVKRTKEEVHAHLPKANYIPLTYQMDPAHKKVYDQLAEEQLLELDSGAKVDATTAQTLYSNLQQIILQRRFFMEEDIDPQIFKLINVVCDEIDVTSHSSSKLILWTWFKRSTEATVEFLERLKIKTAVAYSGSNSAKNVQQFLDDPDTRVLVAQPGSAGAGLNPQHLCWEMMFLETPTRTIQFKQAAGRIDRQGQRYNPNIRLALAEGTIQHRLHANLLTNDALVTQITGGVQDLRKAIYGG